MVESMIRIDDDDWEEEWPSDWIPVAVAGSYVAGVAPTVHTMVEWVYHGSLSWYSYGGGWIPPVVVRRRMVPARTVRVTGNNWNPKNDRLPAVAPSTRHTWYEIWSPPCETCLDTGPDQ